MEPVLPFLFMGCWNRRGPGRNAVISAICDDPIPRLVLGGDNVYPEKINMNGKKVKTYNIGLLEEGLTALACKTLIGTALGNHNVSTAPIAEAQIGRLTPSGRTYYRKSFSDVDLVFLDTNVTGGDISTMLTWLAGELESLRTVGKHYYIIQHEPVIGFKKEGIHALVFGLDLMNVLVTYPPRAILCADTHHYQYGTIIHKGVEIEQHIVGSGGASHDTMDSDPADDTIKQVFVYKRLNYIPGYGYARVTSEGVKFVHVADWSVGGRRRTRRRRRSGNMRFKKSRRQLRR